jgi:hypothetical protein
MVQTGALRSGAVQRVAPARALLLAAVLAAAAIALHLSGWPAGPVSRDVALPEMPAAASLGEQPGTLPTQARGAISTALGVGEPAFLAHPVDGGYRLHGGGVTALLHGRLASLSAPGGSLTLRLLGAGSRDPAARPGAVEEPLEEPLEARGNRVTVRLAGIREWWAAGPLGIEQGFAVDRTASPRGRLTLRLALGGTLRPRTEGGEIALVDRSGATVVRYGGLSAVDARGRSLRASLTLSGRSLLLRVRTAGARYPVRIDPFVQQGAKLTPEDESGNGEFGASVALSDDGNTAVVGGPWDGEHAGAVWVFTRTGPTWTQQGPKLTGGGEEIGKAEFGGSVALSADASTLLVGASGDNGKRGAAWVFTRSGATWTRQAKLTGDGEIGTEPQFGVSVALSGDGSTALVGGYGDNGYAGAGWVFTRSGAAWSEGEKLTAAGESGPSEVGFSSAISGDGKLALLGAPGDSNSTGAAWKLTRSEGSWAQQKLTTPEASENTEFGYSVSLNPLGTRALIGGFKSASLRGAAWEFGGAEAAGFNQIGTALIPADNEGAPHFGVAVAQSGIGGDELIGGPFDAAGTGAAWLFGSAFLFGAPLEASLQLGPKRTGAGEEGAGHFGSAVALSNDGDTALVGGSQDAAQRGAAWVLVDPPPLAETSAATEVSTYAATLTATLPFAGNPLFLYYFEYGTTTAYGARATSGVFPALLFERTEVPYGYVTPADLLLGYPLRGFAGALAPGTTYHYRVVTESSAGIRYGADQTFTTATAAGPPRRSSVLPLALTNARQSHRVWRRGGRLAQISRTRRVPVGTTFSFALNQPARVTFAFTQRARGRKVKGRCVAQTRRNRRRSSCRRTVTRGTFSFAAHTGSNIVVFQGRLSRARRLLPGAYTLLITAVGGAGQRSATSRLAFTIVS